MEMNREKFMELMGFNEGDNGMEYADECHNDGQSWWEIAKCSIATMNMLLND